MAFIEARELRKTYHVGKIEVEALRGISFSVQKGEFVSVVGPSGSGKSTLFYLLGGLTRADGGSVVLDGDDLAKLSDAERTRMRKRKIGFVFQKFNLLPTLDAHSNILMAQEISGNGDRDPAYFNRITELLGLSKRLKHRPSELSGGEQQRVALARALVVEPKVLLMDEPLSNLDAKVRQRLRAELRQLQRQVGITAIYVTHDQEEALALADTVVLMDQGTIVQTGTPQEIYLKPTTAFAAEFLGVSNQLEGEVKDGRLVVAGQALPYTGAVRGKATVIFRASDVQMEAPSSPPRTGTMALNGVLERACSSAPSTGTTSAWVVWW